MVKKVHDKRPFYDRRIEPVVDLEWDKADFDLKICGWAKGMPLTIKGRRVFSKYIE